jgi:NTE family protein
METRRTAFVFAGGGSLGAVEVGMLKALVEAGVKADLVAGSSVGAINAVYFAAIPDDRGVEGLERIWRSLRSADIFPVSPWRGILSLVGYAPSFVDPSGLRAVLEKHLPTRQIEDTVLPCSIIATQLRTGMEVRLESGNALDALMASAAIPGVFPPVVIDGDTLIDGGVAANSPISSVVARGATRILLLPTGFSCSLESGSADPLTTAMHALNLMIAGQLRREIEFHSGRCRIFVAPPLCPLTVTPYDFSAAGEMIDRAYDSTREWLASGGLEIADKVPSGLVPHSHG